MIRITADPNIGSIGPLLLSWHGLFTFVGVVVAIFLVARWARRAGIGSEAVYNIAIWAVLGGIIGARVVHVVDFWEVYQNDLTSILALNTGGVGLWGGLLGGLAGGLISAWRMGYPIRRIMDLTAPAMLLSQAVGTDRGRYQRRALRQAHGRALGLRLLPSREPRVLVHALGGRRPHRNEGHALRRYL